MSDSSAERNPVEVLAEEFLARDRRGERPSLSEYVARYPELADAIHELFPVLLDMENARQNAAEPTGPVPAPGAGYARRVDVTSLGYRTDLMIRALEGSQVVDHPGYVTVRTPANPAFWWGNFILLPAGAAGEGPEPGLARFRSEFPDSAHVALGIDVTSGAAAIAVSAAQPSR